MMKMRTLSWHLLAAMAASLVLAAGSAWAAGNVTVTLKSGSLTIVGDDANNDISVVGTDLDEITVSGNDGTTINGEGEEVFEGPFKHIVIKLADGADVVEVEEIDIEGKLNIRKTASDLTVNCADCLIGKDLKLRQNGMDCGLAVTDSTIGGKLQLRLKDGDADVDLENSMVGKDVKIGSGDGRFEVDLVDATIEGNLLLSSKAGFAPVFLTDVDIGGACRLLLDTGDSAAALGLTGVTTGKTSRLRNRGDNTTLVISSLVCTGSLFLQAAGGNKLVALQSTEGHVTITGHVKIEVGDGDDLVSLVRGAGPYDLTIGGNVTIRTGDGDKQIVVHDSDIGRHLSIATRDGDDDVGIDESTVGGNVKTNLKNGANTVLIEDGTVVHDNCSLKGGNDHDELVVSEVTVDGKLKMDARGDDDTLSVLDSDCGQIQLKGGDGDDGLTCDGSSADKAIFDGGKDEDTLILDVGGLLEYVIKNIENLIGV